MGSNTSEDLNTPEGSKAAVAVVGAISTAKPGSLSKPETSQVQPASPKTEEKVKKAKAKVPPSANLRATHSRTAPNPSGTQSATLGSSKRLAVPPVTQLTAKPTANVAFLELTDPTNVCAGDPFSGFLATTPAPPNTTSSPPSSAQLPRSIPQLVDSPTTFAAKGKDSLSLRPSMTMAAQDFDLSSSAVTVVPTCVTINDVAQGEGLEATVGRTISLAFRGKLGSQNGFTFQRSGSVSRLLKLSYVI